LQVALLGPVATLDNKQWCGMIPPTLVYDVSRKQGIPGAINSIWVRHLSGGVSTLEIKSYDQKREAFQGTTRHVCWLDEEPPQDIYSESLIRTMTCDGLMIVTMTPLMGLTPFLSEWLERSVLETIGEDGKSTLGSAQTHVFGKSEDAENPDKPDEDLSRYTVMATWDDAPHLSEKAKAEMLREFPAYQRDARSRGIPALGSGAIYPIPESEVRCAPFEIPEHWPRAFAMDTGWDWTAAVWGAVDRETQTCYIYAVYKRSHAEAPIHAEAIRAKGAWIPGVGDAAAISNQDGQQFLGMYRRLGLDLELADKSVEAGIQEVWERLSAGKLKVFSSCGPFFDEYRLYRRDEKGRIVKQNDHICDCVRMIIRSGLDRAKVKPFGSAPKTLEPRVGDTGWMGQ
jgi:phage terminase large subunit-like protein